jgi:hypothetical protein
MAPAVEIVLAHLSPTIMGIRKSGEDRFGNSRKRKTDERF